MLRKQMMYFVFSLNGKLTFFQTAKSHFVLVLWVECPKSLCKMLSVLLEMQ